MSDGLCSLRRAVMVSVLLCCGVLPAALGQDAGRVRRRPASAEVGEAAEPAPKPPVEAPPEPEAGEDVMEEYVRLAASFGLEEEEEREIFFYRCRHVRSVTLRKVIESFLTPGGTVADSDEADIVIVADVTGNIERLKDIAEKVDQPVPLILVEARIVELTIDSDFEKELSIAYKQVDPSGNTRLRDVSAIIGTPGANPNTDQGILFNLTPPISSGDGVARSLSIFLRYLETRGKARILSAPSLVLRRGAEGSIITGEEVPILTQTVTSGSISTSTEFKSVGIKLRVLPLMVADGRVRLEISPEVSTVTGFSNSGEGLSNPIIAVRNAKTELEIVSGQLISIGGLLRDEEREVHRQVPLLGSIPILGELFRSTRIERVQTQLVIFLTIRVLADGDAHVATVRPNEVPEGIAGEVRRMEKTAGSGFSKKPYWDTQDEPR